MHCHAEITPRLCVGGLKKWASFGRPLADALTADSKMGCNQSGTAAADRALLVGAPVTVGVGSDHLSPHRLPDQAHSLLFIIPFPASRRRQVAAHQAVAMLPRGQRSVALFTGGRPECSPITRSA